MSILFELTNNKTNTGTLYRIVFLIVTIPSVLVMAGLLMYLFYLCMGRTPQEVEAGGVGSKVVPYIVIFTIISLGLFLISLWII